MPLLGGGVAGLYVFEEETGWLRENRRLRSGSGPGRWLVRSAWARDWSASALRTARLSPLPSLPPDYLRIASGLGAATPARVFASPLLSKDTLLGVVEIATFRSFDSRQQALLGELMPLVAMSLEILQRNLRTQELLGQTQLATRADRRLTAQQKQLRETEQFFRSVLELAPDGLMVVDAKGVIRLANAQCEKLFGHTREELIGPVRGNARAAGRASGTCARCGRASIGLRSPVRWARTASCVAFARMVRSFQSRSA